MVICPECREEYAEEEGIGYCYVEMNFCPRDGTELQDKAQFKSNEKANDEDDAMEARKLEAINDS